MVQRFPMTLTQLTYFVECAKTLNMTVASANLHIAQSAVSTAISQLERSLGATLFIRERSKGLILTAPGEGLLRDSHQLFEFLTSAMERLRDDHGAVRGSISVACFSPLAPFFLPRLISRLRARHPELGLTVIEGDHEDNLTALRSGRAELAINYNLTAADDIRREELGEARPHVIVPAGHPLAARRSVALAELAEEPFVLLDLPSSTDYFLGMLRGAGITPRLEYRSSSYETVRSMVGAGLGFSILNQRPRISGTYTGDRTAVLEIEDAVPSLIVTAATLSQVTPSARVLAVTALFRELLAEATPPAATGAAGVAER
ncbi:LysR substrate-binding domain-containing protein [Leucobacter sp. M11]|nr:LysR substrate-binding domain-containing protein [Leucobacter sp. M11]